MRFCLHICLIGRKGQLGMSLFELPLSFSFLCSEFDGNPSDLNLGDEMEYSLRSKGGKISAESLVKLPQGTILVANEFLPELYQGKVLRPLRRADPQVNSSSKKNGLLFELRIRVN